MNRFLMRPLLLLLLLSMTVITNAQVNTVFNAAVMGKDMRGLSGVQMINSTDDNYSGTMDIEVRIAAGNAVVVKVTITDISIRAGNNVIPPVKFNAAAIIYANTAEGNFVRQTGMFPEGELEYCFRLTVSAKNNPAEVYENCFNGINTVSGPLELVFPANGDNFCDKRPRFNWQPPMPLQAGTTFTIKLARKEEGQSQAEALLLNPPVFYQARLRNYIYPYPPASPDLKEGSTYVWQVTAEYKGISVLSEVWEFTIECEKQSTTDKSFRELKPEDDGGFLSTGPSLRFAVYNTYIPGPLRYTITDLVSPEKKIKSLPDITLQKGANNILLDLRKIPGMVDGNEYNLLVMLPDGKKVSLRFKYTEDDE